MNLLDINELSSGQILNMFQLTDEIKMNMHRNTFKGKTFILFFPESSIRTRITFEKGIKELGGECILFPSETLDKREQLRDVIKYIENWAHAVIVRHSDFSKIQELSRHSTIPIINAMTDVNHPCEILSDLYSISKRKSQFQELVYTFVGAPGNICKSWASIAKVMRLKFNHVCTNGYELGNDSDFYKFYTNLDEVLMQSNIILTDSLPKELQYDEYIIKYQITLERMKLVKKLFLLNILLAIPLKKIYFLYNKQ